MWPFDRGSSRRERHRNRMSRSDETDDTDDDNDDEPETKTVTRTKTSEKSYTEHTATARFIDGTEREYVFDGMYKGDTGITLKNFTGAYYKPGTRRRPPRSGFYDEAFMTIPYNNLKDFETTDREEKSMEYEYEVTEEVPVDEVDNGE